MKINPKRNGKRKRNYIGKGALVPMLIFFVQGRKKRVTTHIRCLTRCKNASYRIQYLLVMLAIERNVAL